MTLRSANIDLSPLPDDASVISAVAGICSSEIHVRWARGATANQVARLLGVQPTNRMGRGAVKGSWSGTMSPGLRIAPRLRALARKNLLAAYYDSENYRWEYWPVSDA